MRPWSALIPIVLAFAAISRAALGVAQLDRQFASTIHPFLQKYCITCHGKDKPEAEFDLVPMLRGRK